MSKPKQAEKVTLFSIDPSTGEPYMSMDYARDLITHHVINYAPWAATRGREIDDVIQDCTLKMWTSKYDPTLSAPRTFAIIMIRGCCGHYLVGDTRQKCTGSNVKDKDGKTVRRADGTAITRSALVLQEQVALGPDGDLVSSLDLKPCLDTPELELIAKEEVAARIAQEEENLAKRANAYKNRQKRLLGRPVASRKRCRACGQSKKRHLFRKNRYMADLIHSVCKYCSKKQHARWFKKTYKRSATKPLPRLSKAHKKKLSALAKKRWRKAAKCGKI